MMAVAGEFKGVEAFEHLTLGTSANSDGSVYYQMYLLCRKLNKPDDAAIAGAAPQSSKRLSMNGLPVEPFSREPRNSCTTQPRRMRVWS